MSTGRGPTRRQVLAGGIATGAVAVAGAAAATWRLFLAADPDPALEGVRRVGLVYLAEHPEASSEQALRAELPPGWDADPDSPLARMAELRDRVRADFAEGRTVLVGGWRLARTSAAAAALVVVRADGR